MKPRRRPLDYKKLRETITPFMALTAHGWRCNYIALDYHRGLCPVHKSTHRSSRTFSAGAVFARCWKCKWHGDAVQLWAELYQLPVLEAAYDLCERLGIDPPYLTS